MNLIPKSYSLNEKECAILRATMTAVLNDKDNSKWPSLFMDLNRLIKRLDGK